LQRRSECNHRQRNVQARQDTQRHEEALREWPPGRPEADRSGSGGYRGDERRRSQGFVDACAAGIDTTSGTCCFCASLESACCLMKVCMPLEDTVVEVCSLRHRNTWLFCNIGKLALQSKQASWSAQDAKFVDASVQAQGVAAGSSRHPMA
jgi:hypothetical protein